MLITKCLCGQMIVNQINTKPTGKFRNFISKILTCIANFSLIEVAGKLGLGYPTCGTVGWWITQLVSSHCLLVTQDYSQVSLGKLQKLFKEMNSVIVTSNLIFISSILLKISLHYHKTNLTKYLASFDKSVENPLLNRFSNKPDNCLQMTRHKPI